MDNPKKTKKQSFDKQVLNELQKGPMTTHDIRELGPFHPAGVICRLREKHSISTTPVTVTDDQGISHRGVALYELEEVAGGSNE